MVRIPIFNWNGTLLDDLKLDEKKFDIKIVHVPGEGCMGFEVFDVDGFGLNIVLWLIHYDLDEDLFDLEELA